MATRAEEPHPWDMLSPMRSLGVQVSQVKVPPALRMAAHPGNDGVGEDAHHVGVPAGGVQGPQQLHAVVGLHRDVEGGHVGGHRGDLGGGTTPVGQGGHVGQLRGVGALWSVGSETVDVDARRPPPGGR